MQQMDSRFPGNDSGKHAGTFPSPRSFPLHLTTPLMMRTLAITGLVMLLAAQSALGRAQHAPTVTIRGLMSGTERPRFPDLTLGRSTFKRAAVEDMGAEQGELL